MLSQANFNTSIIPIITELVVYDEDGMYCGQVGCPADLDGEEYAVLFEYMVNTFGLIPIGLYRAGNVLPYVLTNPPPRTLVSKRDKVFVIGS